MSARRMSAVAMTAVVLCTAWAAQAVELDTMCFIRDTVELYQIAQAVAPEGITVTGYSARGGCDTMTLTLTIEGSPWPIPVVMQKVSNCTLHVSVPLGPVPVIDSLIDVCALPPMAVRLTRRASPATGLSVVPGEQQVTVTWASGAQNVDLALYRLDGTLVGRASPAVGQNSHTWERGSMPPGRYVCVLRVGSVTRVAGFVW